MTSDHYAPANVPVMQLQGILATILGSYCLHPKIYAAPRTSFLKRVTSYRSRNPRKIVTTAKGPRLTARTSDPTGCCRLTCSVRIGESVHEGMLATACFNDSRLGGAAMRSGHISSRTLFRCI